MPTLMLHTYCYYDVLHIVFLTSFHLSGCAMSVKKATYLIANKVYISISMVHHPIKMLELPYNHSDPSLQYIHYMSNT